MQNVEQLNEIDYKTGLNNYYQFLYNNDPVGFAKSIYNDMFELGREPNVELDNMFAARSQDENKFLFAVKKEIANIRKNKRKSLN